ncbi:hypothetical protein Smp_176800 [Schistosoma mansoni]|uniref:hypothetical protein n=1 Tax=Schistosoma mansoni TaxID=6183 RepID=UPI00022C86BD|nr:hypothetical protein Smp_176800 [Schistosoma mansoni]|eukprot:XP_018645111.1 hypothetical protein Smp_176800 [Schistosoma mansoni]
MQPTYLEPLGSVNFSKFKTDISLRNTTQIVFSSSSATVCLYDIHKLECFRDSPNWSHQFTWIPVLDLKYLLDNVLESPDDLYNWHISKVIFVNTSTTARQSLAAVLVNTNQNRSLVCFFRSLSTAKCNIAILINGAITSLEWLPLIDIGCKSSESHSMNSTMDITDQDTSKGTNKTLSSVLSIFDGCFALGFQQGLVGLLDMCLTHTRDDLSNDQPETSIAVERSHCLHCFSCKQPISQPSDDNVEHSLVYLDASVLRWNDFTYKSVSGKTLSSIPSAGVYVSALSYIPQLQGLAVGFSFGGWQLWSLDRLNMEFCMRQATPATPVVSFNFLEPSDDPRFCCFIWVGWQSKQETESDGVFKFTGKQNSIGNFQSPTVKLFQLSYRRRYELFSNKHKEFNFYYQDLIGIAERLSTTLSGDKIDDNKPQYTSRLLSVQSLHAPGDFIMDNNNNHHPNHTTNNTTIINHSVGMIRLIAFIWKFSESIIRIGLFDLDRWYHAQMPTYIRSDDTFVSIFDALIPNQKVQLLHTYLIESSLMSFWSRIVQRESNLIKSCQLYPIQFKPNHINHYHYKRSRPIPEVFLRPSSLSFHCLLFWTNDTSNHNNPCWVLLANCCLEHGCINVLKNLDNLSPPGQDSPVNLNFKYSWIWLRFCRLKSRFDKLTSVLFMPKSSDEAESVLSNSTDHGHSRIPDLLELGCTINQIQLLATLSKHWFIGKNYNSTTTTTNSPRLHLSTSRQHPIEISIKTYLSYAKLVVFLFRLGLLPQTDERLNDNKFSTDSFYRVNSTVLLPYNSSMLTETISELRCTRHHPCRYVMSLFIKEFPMVYSLVPTIISLWLMDRGYFQESISSDIMSFIMNSSEIPSSYQIHSDIFPNQIHFIIHLFNMYGQGDLIHDLLKHLTNNNNSSSLNYNSNNLKVPLSFRQFFNKTSTITPTPTPPNSITMNHNNNNNHKFNMKPIGAPYLALSKLRNLIYKMNRLHNQTPLPIKVLNSIDKLARNSFIQLTEICRQAGRLSDLISLGLNSWEAKVLFEYYEKTGQQNLLFHCLIARSHYQTAMDILNNNNNNSTNPIHSTIHTLDNDNNDQRFQVELMKQLIHSCLPLLNLNELNHKSAPLDHFKALANEYKPKQPTPSSLSSLSLSNKYPLNSHIVTTPTQPVNLNESRLKLNRKREYPLKDDDLDKYLFKCIYTPPSCRRKQSHSNTVTNRLIPSSNSLFNNSISSPFNQKPISILKTKICSSNKEISASTMADSMKTTITTTTTAAVATIVSSSSSSLFSTSLNPIISSSTSISPFPYSTLTTNVVTSCSNVKDSSYLMKENNLLNMNNNTTHEEISSNIHDNDDDCNVDENDDCDVTLNLSTVRPSIVNIEKFQHNKLLQDNVNNKCNEFTFSAPRRISLTSSNTPIINKSMEKNEFLFSAPLINKSAIKPNQSIENDIDKVTVLPISMNESNQCSYTTINNNDNDSYGSTSNSDQLMNTSKIYFMDLDNTPSLTKAPIFTPPKLQNPAPILDQIHTNETIHDQLTNNDIDNKEDITPRVAVKSRKKRDHQPHHKTSTHSSQLTTESIFDHLNRLHQEQNHYPTHQSIDMDDFDDTSSVTSSMTDSSETVRRSTRRVRPPKRYDSSAV